MDKKICPVCGRTFDPAGRAQPTARAGAIAQIVYCSDTCKRKKGNKRHYSRHRRDIIDRNNERQKRDRRKGGTTC